MEDEICETFFDNLSEAMLILGIIEPFYNANSIIAKYSTEKVNLKLIYKNDSGCENWEKIMFLGKQKRFTIIKLI